MKRNFEAVRSIAVLDCVLKTASRAQERADERDLPEGIVGRNRSAERAATWAPYSHNGSASDLGAAVDFYNEQFGIGLTDDEKDDLVAFLLTL